MQGMTHGALTGEFQRRAAAVVIDVSEIRRRVMSGDHAGARFRLNHYRLEILVIVFLRTRQADDLT